MGEGTEDREGEGEGTEGREGEGEAEVEPHWEDLLFPGVVQNQKAGDNSEASGRRDRHHRGRRRSAYSSLDRSRRPGIGSEQEQEQEQEQEHDGDLVRVASRLGVRNRMRRRGSASASVSASTAMDSLTRFVREQEERPGVVSARVPG